MYFHLVHFLKKYLLFKIEIAKSFPTTLPSSHSYADKDYLIYPNNNNKNNIPFKPYGKMGTDTSRTYLRIHKDS